MNLMKCDFGRTMGKGGENAYQSRLKKETMKSNGREKEEMGKWYMAIGEEKHVQWLGAFWEIYIS